jgi:uncharacterized protein with ATP-grasp and redox domains
VRACLDCLPCLARNATELARRSARGDAALEGRIAAEGMRILGRAAEAGYPLPPPCYARQLIDNALAMSGGAVPDPWAPEKKTSTELALKLLERMDEILGWGGSRSSATAGRAGSPLPAATAVAGRPPYHADALERVPPEMPDFEKRLRLAIAGNILDFSIYADLDMAAAMETMATAFTKPIDTAAVAELKRRMDEAKSILWIFDNCGEAVFDRLLMEPYREKITLAVRGKPAFNDLTRAELAESGYPEGYAAGGVVSNDDGVPGVVDATCGTAFRAAFSRADLIIAKGQANFETMSARTDKPIAFLFLAKCPVVCREVGAQPQTIQVVLHNFERIIEK